MGKETSTKGRGKTPRANAQFIFAIPSLEMVVVITSDNEETEEFMMGIYTILYDHILQVVEEY